MTTIKAIFHLLCLTPILLQAQPEIAWQRCYGSSGWDAFADVEMTSDGGYITSVEYGSTDFDATGVSGLERPATLMKFDSAFNLLWYSSFGGYTNASNFFELAVLEDKGFIAFGNTYASDSDFADNHGPNYSDLMLVRTDSLGQKLWSKCYGSPGDDFPASFMVTKDKGYLLLGYSNSEGGDVPDHYGTGFSHDIIIIKTDSLGNILWSQNMGTSGDDGVLSNPLEIDRGYYILNLSCIGDDYDMAGVSGDIKKRWLVNMDSLGNIIDENIIVSENDLHLITGTTMLAVGDLIYHCTSSNSATTLFEDVEGIGGEFDGALAVFNKDLDFIDLKVFGGTEADFIDKLIRDEFGNIFLLGLSKSSDGDLPGNYNLGDYYDYWLMKLNDDLELQWSRNFGGSGNAESSGSHIVGDIIIKNNQLLYFGISQALQEMPNYDIECGHYNVLTQPSMDAWLVAFDLSTGIPEQIQPASAFELYPNPTLGSLIIASHHQQVQELTILLYDIAGKKVYSNLFTSSSEYALDLQSLPKGIYGVSIVENDAVVFQTKLILQ